MSFEFTSLHHHSTFSFMDGFGTPEQHVARVAELGMDALALTEHGNVSSHVQLEQAAKRHNIKPIFGCELYCAEEKTRTKNHLTVVAETQVGYQNLMEIVTRSWDEGFYGRPTVSEELLFNHSKGLIVLSGCSTSRLATDLLGNYGGENDGDQFGIGKAVATARRFREGIVGAGGRYYLEVQAFPDLERTRRINEWYSSISGTLAIDLAATIDAHYPTPEDNEIQKVLHAAGRGLGTAENAEASWEYSIRLTLPGTSDDLEDSLLETGLSASETIEAIRNSYDIGRMCNVQLPKADIVRFPVPNSKMKTIEYFWDLLRKGWKFRKSTNTYITNANKKKYIDRLHYEMDILTKKDFLDYFLVLADGVIWAKDHGIAVGPARGSAAASLVCWLLRITEIDPMQFPAMMFERFIDENREDMPDIDLDFDDVRRSEVRDYFASKYGDDNVGNVCNYTHYKGRNSIDDVARAYELPRIEMAKLKDMIIERPEGDERFSNTIEDTVYMFPEAARIYRRYQDLEFAERLEGNYRGLGIHAAGLVVSSSKLSNVCATYRRGPEKTNVLSVDKRDAEYLNLIKIDLLGLSTMGMIANALELIGMSLVDLYSIPLDNEKTMKAFRRGDTIGIFQWDGVTTSMINGQVKPTKFMELADINAMSRPGSLFSGATDAYIRAKNLKENHSKLHPLLTRYTKDTHGQIVYQEQVLAIIRDVGGFAPKEVNGIRKIIGKKKGASEFEKLHAQFNDGAKRLHKINADTADKIWDYLIASAGYSFNIAHSVSYSMLAFWCQWIKQHHPVEFYCAQLRKTDKGKWARLIKDADAHGVTVAALSLAELSTSWTVVGQSVRAGLTQVPGIGAKVAELIMAEAATGGPFASWQEVERRTKGVGPKKIELIQDFADSLDPYGIGTIRDSLNKARKELRDEYTGLPRPTHDSSNLPQTRDDGVVWLGYVQGVKIIDYVECEHQATGHSIEKILREMEHPELMKSAKISCYDDGNDPVQIKINRFNYPRFEKIVARISAGDMILVKGTKYASAYKTVHARTIFILED